MEFIKQAKYISADPSWEKRVPKFKKKFALSGELERAELQISALNHYAYGAVAAWMYRTVAGIRSDENAPAYKHVFICPITDKRLGSAKARIDTRNGSVVSEWAYEDDDVRYCFTVPKGVTATVTVDGKTEELSEGTYTRWSKA